MLRRLFTKHASLNTRLTSPSSPWPWAVLALGIALPLLTALWVAAGLLLSAPSPWMAVVAAADASLMLRLLRVPAGNARVAAALAFTLLCAALSLWIIVAGIVGPAFGLLPWESALRLGPVLFGAIASNWLDAASGFWLIVALGLAWWWNR